MVIPQDIDDIIARITGHILLRRNPGIRRITHYDIVQSPVISQILDRPPEKGDILIRRTKGAAPPEPAADILMPRPENDRYQISLIVTERVHEIAQPLQPDSEQLRLLPSFEDRSHCLVGTDIPGITACIRIVRVP